MHKSNVVDELMKIVATFLGGGLNNGHGDRQVCTKEQSEYLFLFGSNLLVLL